MNVFLWLFWLFIGRGKSLNSSQTKFSWEPLEPLLFNEDVILKCFIKDCCPEGTQWTGGKTNSLLTLGRVSNNKAKYEESWGVDASYLKIKKFGIDDGDSLYTCFHGFSKYSKNLTINGNKFALMPTEESLKKNVTVRNGYLNANVEFLKVYPEPECNCTFQKLGITEHINVSSDFYPTSSIFLNGKLHIGHQICYEECLGTIQINCRIGLHEFKILEAIVDIQFIESLQKKKDKDFSTIICVIFTVVAVTMLVAIVVYVRWRKETTEHMSLTEDILQMSYPVENEQDSNSLPNETHAEHMSLTEDSLQMSYPVENEQDSNSLPNETHADSAADSLLGKTNETTGDMPEKTQVSSAIDSIHNKGDTKAGRDPNSRTNGSAGCTSSDLGSHDKI